MLGIEQSYETDIKNILQFRDLFDQNNQIKLYEFSEIVNYFFDRYVHKSWEKQKQTFFQRIQQGISDFSKSLDQRIDDSLNKMNCPRDLIEELDNNAFLVNLEARGYEFPEVVQELEDKGYINKQRTELLIDQYQKYLRFGGFYDEMNATFNMVNTALTGVSDVDLSGNPSESRTSIRNPRNKKVISVDFKNKRKK